MKPNYPEHLQRVFEAIDFALEQEEVYSEIALKKRRKEVPFYKLIKKYFITNGIQVHKNTYPKGTKMADVVFGIKGIKFYEEVGHRTIIQTNPAYWTLNKARDGFRKMDEGGVDLACQQCIEILTDFEGNCQAYQWKYPVFQSYLGQNFNSQEREVRLDDVKSAINQEYGENQKYFSGSVQIEQDLIMHLHIWVIWQ